MDSHNPTQLSKAARARQRQRTNSSARRRQLQRQAGGGVVTRRREDTASQPRSAEEPRTGDTPITSVVASTASALRDRLQSGASATRMAMTEQMRRLPELRQRMQDARKGQSIWIFEPSWYERIRNRFSDAMPFTWRERARRRGFWRKKVAPVALMIASLALVLGVGVFALRAFGHAAGAFTPPAPAAQATAGGAVMISPLNNGSTTPTPAAPQYDIGVWVSDTLPQGGSVTVYARVSNNSQPAPGARVVIDANTPNGTIRLGPLTTDGFGLVSATLNYGGVGPQKPIFLTATTTISGKTYTGTYTFVTYG